MQARPMGPAQRKSAKYVGTTLPALAHMASYRSYLIGEYVKLMQGSETDHPVSSRRPGKRVTHVTSTADALDLQTVPRRFNTSDVPNLCIQVQTIRSAQQPQVSRSDIKAPHSPSASVPFTGRHVKDAKRRDNKRVRDAEREARVKQNEQDRQAKSAEKRVRGAHATGEIRVCIDSRLASLKHGKAIVAALGTSEVEYRYEMKLGELEKWSTLIWYRDVGTVCCCRVLEVCAGCGYRQTNLVCMFRGAPTDL